jgi:release factor glutamine methyltransferase
MPIQKSPIDSSWTILKIIQWATSYFKSNQIDSPRLTIEILLAHVLDVDRIDLYLAFDKPLHVDELTLLKSLIKRRINREPVAYITGKKEFFGLEFDVASDVLIPRPETEFLVEEALKFIPQNAIYMPMNILDMGTGSGAIIITLSKNRPGHRFFASDISVAVLTIARANAKKHGVQDISFFAGNWFAPIAQNRETFDIIVSNPPYIPVTEIDRLAPEIVQYEPAFALDGGDDGMQALKILIEGAPLYLNPGGMMLLEIGHDQRDQLSQEINNFSNLTLDKFIRDYGGHDRVAVIRKKK